MNKAFLHEVRIVNKIYVSALLILIATSYVLSSSTLSLTDLEKDQVIARIGLLSPAEKALLNDKLERFSRLSPSEQQRLREFHETLNNHARSTPLLNLLKEYNDWINQLTPGDRVAMQTAADDSRIETLNQILNAQLSARFNSLAGQELIPEDSASLLEWVKDLHEKYGDRIEGDFIRIYDLLTKDEQNKIDEVDNEAPNHTRSKLLMFYAFQRAPDIVKELVPEWNQEEHKLLSDLSADAQFKFFNTQENEQTDLILNWIESAIWLQFMFEVGIDDAELARFFAEDLNEQERRMIEQSPEFRQRLLFVYFNKSSERNQRVGNAALASGQDVPNSSQLDDGAPAPGIGTTVIGAVPFMRQAIEELLPDLDEDQLALLENLSPGASSVIDAMEDTASEAEKVINWMQNAVKSQFFSQTDVNDEDLQAFLEDDLTDEEREYLKQVPPLQYRKTLLFLFYQKQDEVEKSKSELAEPVEDQDAEKQTSESAN